MKDTLNKIQGSFKAVFSFLFTLEMLIILLFLCGLGVILYTVYMLNIIAFGFTLGAVMIAIAFMLHDGLNGNSQK